ncbi:MAG: sel1 repeat family protein [Bacilli bacterium]|nr:sel1 repeat family protein [Bacilli bacterium]
MRKRTDNEPYESYRRHAVDNEIEIVQSDICGCFFCRSIFSARDVNDWYNDDRGMSALCPECGMDAVIGDASGIKIDKPLLKQMNVLFYGESYMAANPAAARVYCGRYIDGHITHKPHNEELFVKYLCVLADNGDERSMLAAAEIYENGGEYVHRDLDKAIAYLQSPLLSANHEALCHLGALYLRGEAGPEFGARDAYECFAKAAALGSMRAVYLMADMYFNGDYVQKDEKFAFSLLEQSYDDIFHGYAYDSDFVDLFPEFNYRIAKCFQYGFGVEIDEMSALRHYLLAQMGLQFPGIFDLARSPMVKDVAKEINALAKKFGLRRGSPVYDSDTFYDSFIELNGDDLGGRISNFRYSAKSMDASFDMTLDRAPIIIDIGNLWAGFVPGPITWSFSSVKDALRVKDRFETIRFGNDETWAFCEKSGEGVCASFSFMNEPKKIKIKAYGPKKGKGE